jgi:hypothetical protein
MNLLELQRRMAEDVRRPLTDDFGMRDTSDDGASVGAIAASYISPNDRLSSFERLEIYNRQYWFRLISAVSEDYPTINALLGHQRFDSLILAYLHENPSTSWTLRIWERSCLYFSKNIRSSRAGAIVWPSMLRGSNGRMSTLSIGNI